MAGSIHLGEHAKRVTSFLDEFKAFAFKGNVVDLAVGVIIGAAFSDIVKSLVANIFMPLIAMIMPGEKDTKHGKSGRFRSGFSLAA